MHLPNHHLRKVLPVTDGQVNDIYAHMERKSSPYAPSGHKVSYGIVGVYNSYLKDPEDAYEGYEVLPEKQASVQEAEERRKIENLLVRLGFPLEELTGVDSDTGDVYKLKISEDSPALSRNPWESGDKNATANYVKVYVNDVNAIRTQEDYKKKNVWG